MIVNFGMDMIGKTEKNFKSNRDFWIPKIERNIERDRDVNEYLSNEGWIVLRFWGNEIKKDASKCADIIESAIKERKYV